MTADDNYPHPIGIRGGDLGRDLNSYHPTKQPYNWQIKRPVKTKNGLLLTQESKVEMLRDHLGIDESNILRPDAPERERDAKWLKSPRRDLLQELDLANWEPDRLGWSRKWRPDEVESEWVQRFYSHLFLRLKEFVTVNFGLGDLEDMDPPVWVTRDFSQHLVHYAQIVARQDNRVGGWDELLYSNRPRQYLIMGIIGRMLQTHVFDELLFGGDYSAKAILRTQDQGLVTLEGFQRTDLRGRTVKAILGEESLPTRFWDAVDVLTTKITTTLLPLFDLMDEHFPDRRFVSLRGIYQDLHYIVAEAGFLSLTLRESKDIFRFTWPVPGQAWDLEQDNHDDDVYQASLNENRRLYEEHQRQQHQQEEEDQPSPTSSTSEMFHTPPSSPATAMRFQFLRNLTSRPAPPPPAAPLPDPATQIAKVHIVLWPQLQRFSTPTPQWMEPPNRPDEWFLDPGRQFITEIARARVVYYLGSTDPVAEQAERRPALAEHIASHRSRRGFSPSTAVVVRSLWMLVYVLAAVGAAAALATYFDGTVGFVLGYVRELGFAVLDVFVGAVMGVVRAVGPYVYVAVLLVAKVVFQVLHAVGAVFGAVESVFSWVWRVVSAVFRAGRDAALGREERPRYAYGERPGTGEYSGTG